ncbi:RING-H2 finger protein ATL11-like [Arachis stenosperma]|uniref:RING-H2 finger protein ATL11-like n=1 Tax=Arachis stenosperma TaxID=217475 RepID=UPI0025AD60CB|nr:RING-H2 finger protein ATL11-like [Arachis stenosperma]
MTQNGSLVEHYYMISFLLFALLMQKPPEATSQLITAAKTPTYLSQTSPMEPPNKNSMVAIMIIIVFMFLLSAFISLYSRHCTRRPARVQSRRLNIAMVADELNDRRSHSECVGLSQETIETFPTCLYSSVKGHKIGTCALACAVCISEFEDQETLRLIPKCSHVFHPTCIDAWLASHSTCPVCRADLDPTQNDVHSSSIFSIHIPDDDVINEMEEQGQSNEQEDAAADVMGRDQNDVVEPFSSKGDLLRRSRTVNDVMTGQTLRSLLFPRSNSAGTSLTRVQTGDKDFERFTLRLPSGVRSEVFMNSRLKRAKTCVGLVRMSSGTKGYRTGSVGNCRGDYERWRFTLTPPFLTKNWSRLGRRSASAQCLGVEVDNNNVGERSSDLLFPPSTA